jgi:tRNA/tmRNA/rRNA uracil-C5-methylase (TrmA/RlmC/RlmD family)
MSPGLAVGDVVEVEVERVAHGGHCVARHEGRVLFVRHALPAERVRARITEGADGDRFLRADAVEVVEAAPDRVDAPCPYAVPGGCGGCDFQHADLAAQRRLKADVVTEQFARLARLDIDVTVEAVPGDVAGLRWRTRTEFAVDDEGRPGMRRHRSHDLIPVTDCLIAAPGILATGVLRKRYAAGTTVDVVAPSVGEPIVVELDSGGVAAEGIPAVTEQVSAAWVGPDRWGHELVHEFHLSARGFWQVHPGAVRTFVEAALGFVGPRRGETALDLYSGVGVFALALAEGVGPDGRVIAVESDPVAVECARRNVSVYGTVAVVGARVDDFLGVPRPRRRGAGPRRAGRTAARHPLAPPRVDIVLLDPPRKGAGRDVVAAVAAMAPRSIAYVGCDPAALARDTAYLSGLGYHLTGLRAFDTFPMTHHVECVAHFEPRP